MISQTRKERYFVPIAAEKVDLSVGSFVLYLGDVDVLCSPSRIKNSYASTKLLQLCFPLFDLI